MPSLTDSQLSLSFKTKHTCFHPIFANLSSSVSFPDLSYQWLFFLCFSYRPFLDRDLHTHVPLCFLITVGVYVLIAEGRISVFSHYSVDAVPKEGLGSCDRAFVGICPSTHLCVFLRFRSFPTVLIFFADFSVLGSSDCLFHAQFQTANKKSCIPRILCSRTSLCLCSDASVMSDSLWPHGLNVALQAPLSTGFSRQEYLSDYHALLQGIFPTQGLNPFPLGLLLLILMINTLQ